MVDDTAENEAPTRREYVKYGGAVIGGGLIAGCTGSSSSGSGGNNSSGAGDGSTSAGSGSNGSNSSKTGNQTISGSGNSYSVTMAPMGEVAFESAPGKWMAYFSTYGDMGIALGQSDGLEALIYTENWPLKFFEYLPGVTLAFDGIQQLESESNIDKEAFYGVEADVHLMDPNFIARLDDTWRPEDFKEINSNIGPIVGNSIRRRNEDWHDYRYYSLYEAFEKISTVFQEQRRYQAFKKLHDTFISDLQAELPAKAERPDIGLLSINSDFEKGTFYAYPIHQGNGHKQYRDLGMQGAFDSHIDSSYGEWDYEQILEVDPDALLFQYGFSHVSTDDFEERMQMIRNDPVGQKLSAVKNNNLYRGGTSYQGPIINLFQTEAAAKQFYPGVFGEWNGFETLSQKNERLFDHQRLADIINGNF